MIIYMGLEKIIFDGILITYVFFSIFDKNIHEARWIVAALIFCAGIKLCLYLLKRETSKKIVLAVMIISINIFTWRTGFKDISILIPFMLLQIMGGKININSILLITIQCLISISYFDLEPKVMVFMSLISLAGGAYIYNNEKFQSQAREKIFLLEEERAEIDKLRVENIGKMQILEKVTKVEERNRISQSIHDSIGHTLAGSLMQLQALKMITNDERGQVIINKVIAQLKKGMEDTRVILRKMKPEIHEQGLAELKKLCVGMDSKGYKTELKHADVTDIDNEQWSIINQNVKEGLTNILKYSNGDAVKIQISILNKFIKVEVKDNGGGCSNIKMGLGLRGMEERLQKIGGNLIVDGKSGFSVIQILPRERKN